MLWNKAAASEAAVILKALFGLLIAICAIVAALGSLIDAQPWLIESAAALFLVALGALVGVVAYEEHLRRSGVTPPD
jgi:hypothetical protein